MVFLVSGLLLVGNSVIPPAAQALDLNPLSAIKSVLEAAVEDRSSDDIARDLELKAKITAEVIDTMGTDVISINADVYEQITMLTGAVDRASLKVEAGKLAKNVEGVKKVINEILVIKPLNRKKGAAEAFVDDTVIESKINALLLDGKGVNVTNMRWRSVQGHVFLFGRALSPDERKKAARIVTDIKNVLSVTNHLFVRPKN